jgi:AraC family transcriptional regulator, transcriptional activator of pobA
MPSRALRIDFHRTKYGPEILIDIAWTHEMPTFLRPEPHRLTFYDILLVTRGSGWFLLDGHRHVVRPGQIFFTTPGQIRGWRVRGLGGLCLFFPAAFLDEFFSDPEFLHRLPFFHVPAREGALALRASAARRMERSLARMRSELRHWRSDSPHALRARLYDVLIALARDYRASRSEMPIRSPHRVVLAYRRLVQSRARRGAGHTVADYARELAISPSHLNRLCQRHLGASAKEVLQEQLEVEARRELLLSDRSVAQIAIALGFADPSYFGRFFRRRTGVSPARFRQAARSTTP